MQNKDKYVLLIHRNEKTALQVMKQLKYHKVNTQWINTTENIDIHLKRRAPDIILTQVVGPRINIVKVYHAISEIYSQSQPILIVAGPPHEKIRKLLISAGAYDYLEEPAGFLKIRTAILNAYLKHRDQEQNNFIKKNVFHSSEDMFKNLNNEFHLKHLTPQDSNPKTSPSHESESELQDENEGPSEVKTFEPIHNTDSINDFLSLVDEAGKEGAPPPTGEKKVEHKEKISTWQRSQTLKEEVPPALELRTKTNTETPDPETTTSQVPQTGQSSPEKKKSLEEEETNEKQYLNIVPTDPDPNLKTETVEKIGPAGEPIDQNLIKEFQKRLLSEKYLWLCHGALKSFENRFHSGDNSTGATLRKKLDRLKKKQTKF